MVADKTLVQRCQAGDLEAFAALFDRYRQRIYGLACAILGDEPAAEDIVQETFLTLFQKIDDYRGEAAFATWLTAIAVNHCRSRLRYRKIRRTFSLDNLPARWLGRLSGQNEDPALTAVQRQQERDLWNLVDQLDGRLRLPLILCYRFDFSAKEAAHILGSNPNRIYQQLYEGRRRLRRLAQEAGRLAPQPAGKMDREKC